MFSSGLVSQAFLVSDDDVVNIEENKHSLILEATRSVRNLCIANLYESSKAISATARERLVDRIWLCSAVRWSLLSATLEVYT